jgi:stage IV sporulation protein A
MVDDFGKSSLELFNAGYVNIFREGHIEPYGSFGGNYTVEKLEDGIMKFTIPEDHDKAGKMQKGDILTCRLCLPFLRSIFFNNSKNVLVKDTVLYGYSSALGIVMSGDSANVRMVRWHDTAKYAPAISEATYDKYRALEEKYGVPVALVSCLDLDAEDIKHILGLVLEEFPIAEIQVRMPEWTTALEPTHRIRASIQSALRRCADNVRRAGDVMAAFAEIKDNEYLSDAKVDMLDLGTGEVKISLTMRDGLYYEIISELTGFEIDGEEELISLLRELSAVKTKYDKVSEALAQVEADGYGIVMPDVEDLHLEEPQIVKQSGGYGVKLRAGAQSIHMIRANIQAEINPMVGTEQQSEDLVKYMLREFEEDPKSIWASNMFGKSLYELINEGLHTKLDHMPDESRKKLSETLERIINEGSNGLICILL